MKIGIITQPLRTNYGGILQNYALQTVLKRMGHDVWTIDYSKYDWLDWADHAWRVVVLKILGRESHFIGTPYQRNHVEKPLRRFVCKYIQTTQPRTKRIERRTIRKYAFDALIVGSDQVWRPMYNCRIEDCFLGFAVEMEIKRIAYAASFGTDKWEFTLEQTNRCANLAKLFDGVSVREKSGVTLCKKYLGVKAVQVLDPTLLLSPDDYSLLCQGISRRKPFVFAYILDENAKKINYIKELAERKGLPYIIKGADGAVGEGDTIESWLSYFRDTAFVITDSFHGTVFSIIFNKDFYVFGNEKRGNSRFVSLLDAFGINDRMINGSFPDDCKKIDWKVVNDARNKSQFESKSWLRRNL